jgi:leucyl-tRNA synthetase
MVATNELIKLRTDKHAVLEPAVRLIAPFAPHLAEELYQLLGGTGSVHHSDWPELEERYLVEDTVTYPVAFNGKTRMTIDFPAEASKGDIEAAARADTQVQSYLEGKSIRKVIVVPKRMINFVIS